MFLSLWLNFKCLPDMFKLIIDVNKKGQTKLLIDEQEGTDKIIN